MIFCVDLTSNIFRLICDSTVLKHVLHDVTPDEHTRTRCANMAMTSEIRKFCCSCVVAAAAKSTIILKTLENLSKRGSLFSSRSVIAVVCFVLLASPS